MNRVCIQPDAADLAVGEQHLMAERVDDEEVGVHVIHDGLEALRICSFSRRRSSSMNSASIRNGRRPACHRSSPLNAGCMPEQRGQ